MKILKIGTKSFSDYYCTFTRAGMHGTVYIQEIWYESWDHVLCYGNVSKN